MIEPLDPQPPRHRVVWEIRALVALVGACFAGGLIAFLQLLAQGNHP